MNDESIINYFEGLAEFHRTKAEDKNLPHTAQFYHRGRAEAFEFCVNHINDKGGLYMSGNIDGYLKGLHDGNPFIVASEAITKALESLPEALKNIDTDKLQALLEEQKQGDADQEEDEPDARI